MRVGGQGMQIAHHQGASPTFEPAVTLPVGSITALNPLVVTHGIAVAEFQCCETQPQPDAVLARLGGRWLNQGRWTWSR